jgi:hypothetical protein
MAEDRERVPERSETVGVMARVAQMIIWAVIVVLGVLAYWAYLRLAPMD